MHPIFPGDSQLARLMRVFDWSTTDLGPPERWPESLHMALGICLTSRFPIVLWWGREYTMFYNDAYRSFLGKTKHPWALGRSGQECWQEIWPVIGPMLEGVFATGQATWSQDLLLVLDRDLPHEEGYFTFSYSPILDVPTGVGGIFCACFETTERVVGARRLETLRNLGVQAAEMRTLDGACQGVSMVLAANPYDIPFAAIYLVDHEGARAELKSVTGFAPDALPFPSSVSLSKSDPSPWPLASVLRSHRAEDAGDTIAAHGRLPGGASGDRASKAIALPVFAARRESLAGLAVLGVSPRQVLDDGYRTFFDLIAGHLGTALAGAQALEEERRRAEALAELDRAKTVFFSNVSHEFRTPLTLMLGPIEDMLARVDGSPAIRREELELVHRNSQRLLKLVNTLLDFARIEAGRMQASYEPTDLAAFTAELASVFRSAIENVGLRLSIDCRALDQPVYVDPRMWEKVVLNLLSNAFKFTFEGEIAVSLRQAGQSAELSVRDTGTGIPENALPHLFDRFYRVEGAPGRTFEGSGIGLSLVKQLIDLHGGSVRAESVYGSGSCFVVSIPLGRAHLRAEHLGKTPAQPAVTTAARAYLEETLQWLRDEPGSAGSTFDVQDSTPNAAWDDTGEHQERKAAPPPGQSPIQSPKAKILIADDNADMRLYLRRLLSKSYEVRAAGDGQAALDAAKEDPPDLVLADIMMPRLDGVGLLRALRADPLTRVIPVMMLSARAGEESAVEGLGAGADDYLIKPFSARELLARVGARLEIARLNREALERERRLRLRAEDMETALVRKNDELRRARKALQRELRSRTEDVSQLTEELIAGKQTLLAVKDELAAELAAMSRLHELSTRLSATSELQPLLEEILDASLAIVNADFGIVQLVDPASGALKIVAQRGFQREFLDYFDRVQEGTASCGVALQRRERVIVEDVLTDPIFAPHLPIVGPAGYRAVQSTPLVGRGGAVLGMISTHFGQVHRPSERELRFVDLYARQAADMIERKRAEVALLESEERFRSYFELGLIGMAMTSPSKGILEVNDELCRLLGYERSELLAKTWAEITHPDDLAADVAQFNRVLAGEIDGYSMEKRWIRKDGRVIYGIMAAQCMRRTDGAVDYFVGLVQDISERKRAEEKLLESERRFRLLADSIPHHVWSFRPDSPSLSYWNKRLIDYTGLTPERVKPGSWEIVHSDDAERVKTVWREALAKGAEYEIEQRMRGRDGTYRRFLSHAVPARDERGRVVEWFGTDTDVEEARQSQEALQKLQAELAHVGRVTLMGELAASIAHEINQPLGAIVNNGNVAIRLAGAPGDPRKELLEVLSDIVKDGHRANAIITRLRALAKKSIPEKSSLQLKEVVSEMLAFANRELNEYQITVRTELPNDLPRVSGDRVQLQQVLLNLVINAVEAMSAVENERRILTIRGQRDEMDGRPAVLITVQDLGVGFNPEDNERLFEAFYTTKPDGMGMGLRISRSIIEAHGGRLWATSNDGQGATSHFALPVAEGSE
jgi:PAS domain S-box-containing protein